MARKKKTTGDGEESPAPKRKKDTRDRREYLRNRRADHAKTAEETRAKQGRAATGDKRFPEGRRKAEEAKDGFRKMEDKDLQSPRGGTQREIWVKDPEEEDE